MRGKQVSQAGSGLPLPFTLGPLPGWGPSVDSWSRRDSGASLGRPGPGGILAVCPQVGPPDFGSLRRGLSPSCHAVCVHRSRGDMAESPHWALSGLPQPCDLPVVFGTQVAGGGALPGTPQLSCQEPKGRMAWRPQHWLALLPSGPPAAVSPGCGGLCPCSRLPASSSHRRPCPLWLPVWVLGAEVLTLGLGCFPAMPTGGGWHNAAGRHCPPWLQRDMPASASPCGTMVDGVLLGAGTAPSPVSPPSALSLRRNPAFPGGSVCLSQLPQ